MRDKIRTALDEARILVYGVQVLIGFEYQAAFQKNFPNLPVVSQNLKIASLLLMLVALGLIMAPAAYGQIVEHDNEDPRYLRFITLVLGIALLPFAIGLGGDIYVAVQQVAGTIPGIAAAVVAVVLALFLWYGLELLQRPASGLAPIHSAHGHPPSQQDKPNDQQDGKKGEAM